MANGLQMIAVISVTYIRINLFMCNVLVWHVSGRLALCLFTLNH